MAREVALCAGPLGQCHLLPDDEGLKAEMLKHARNYERIYRSYNLPYQSAPGSDMAKAIQVALLEQSAVHCMDVSHACIARGVPIAHSRCKARDIAVCN